MFFIVTITYLIGVPHAVCIPWDHTRGDGSYFSGAPWRPGSHGSWHLGQHWGTHTLEEQGTVSDYWIGAMFLNLLI